MGREISFMQYMRAHGNTPGPTQRPLLTGAISGLFAEIPSLLTLHLSGTLAALSRNFKIGMWLAVVISVALMMLAGVLYAAVFKRAANDRLGGWLFGISYGFLIWTLSPLTLWQIVTGTPVVTGRAAMGLFGAHLLFGLALGLVFPWVHFLVQMRLRNSETERSNGASVR